MSAVLAAAAAAPKMRPSQRFRWVQDRLSLALNETIKGGDADILSGIGQRLIIMSASDAGLMQAAAAAKATNNSLGELFESIRRHADNRTSSRQAAPVTDSMTVAEWLECQNVTALLAKSLVEPGSLNDLGTLRQLLSNADDARDTLRSRLLSGVDALVDSLMHALAQPPSPDRPPADSISTAEGASQLAPAPEGSTTSVAPANSSATAKEASQLVPAPLVAPTVKPREGVLAHFRVQPAASVPRLLVVGAINVDVTAHVCGEIDAKAASTIVGSDQPPSFTQGGRGFNQAVACARLGSAPNGFQPASVELHVPAYACCALRACAQPSHVVLSPRQRRRISSQRLVTMCSLGV